MRTPKKKPTALNKAVELLAAQEHSEARLREKLLRRGYEGDEIDAAVERLTEKRYIDDEAACAREFAHFYEDSTMSLRQIEQKLVGRGFPRSLVEASVPEDDDRDGRELRAACAALRGRFHGPAPREKMKVFLYRRGFDYGTCDGAVSDFLEENPEYRIEETDYEA